MGTLKLQLPSDFKKRCQNYILAYEARRNPRRPLSIVITAEDQFNREIWWALDKIRKEELRQREGKPIELVLQDRPIMGLPPIDVRRKMLYKVEEFGGIKIVDDKTYDDTYGVDFVYTIEILRPKFEEIYKKYQALNQKPSTEKPKQEQEITITTGQVVGELNLSGYSEDNLRKFSRIITIISNQIELDNWNRLTNIVRIPFTTLERDGFSYEELRSILGSINKINDKKVLVILNESPYKEIQKRPTYLFDDITEQDEEINRKEALRKWLTSEGSIINVSKDDLDKKLVLELIVTAGENPIETLKEWNENINKKLEQIVPVSKIESQEMREPATAGSIRQKTSFNGQTGVVSFGDAIHKFHRGTRGDKKRISLFKKLWDEKKYFKNGIEKTKGKTLTPEFLAVQLNITQNATTFSRNKTATNRFFGLIKGINRTLKDKGFPAKIERQGGIQLVIIEK